MRRANGFRDFLKMPVHRLCVGVWHDDGCPRLAFRADRAEKIGPFVAGIAYRTRRVPLRAQILVSVPFWPTRASSWNQISMGLALACSGRLSHKIPAKLSLKFAVRPRLPWDVSGAGQACGTCAAARCAPRSARKLNAEERLDLRFQIAAAPAHHAVFNGVWRRLHKLVQLCALLLLKQRLASRTLAVFKPVHAFGVEAVNPVPKRLPLHPRALRRIGAAGAIQDRSDGQNRRAWSGSDATRALCRNSAAGNSVLDLDGHAIPCPISIRL